MTREIRQYRGASRADIADDLRRQSSRLLRPFGSKCGCKTPRTVVLPGVDIHMGLDIVASGSTSVSSPKTLFESIGNLMSAVESFPGGIGTEA